MVSDGDCAQAALLGAPHNIRGREAAVAVGRVQMQVGALRFGTKLRQLLAETGERLACGHQAPSAEGAGGASPSRCFAMRSSSPLTNDGESLLPKRRASSIASLITAVAGVAGMNMSS